MRQTVTTYSIDRNKLALTSEPLVDGSPAAITNGRSSVAGSCAFSGTAFNPTAVPRIAHWTVNSCAYLSDALASWRPSLPLSVELQEWNGTAWENKSRAETRYDLATGLPTRTIARKTPAGAATSACDAAIAPQTGDVVSDFYYDDRGNLALKKVHGADDASIFRTYMGTGDKPPAADAPGVAATIGPDASENIYTNAGAYFGFDRWSREFSPGETAPHRFVNSFVDATAADMERISGAIIQSHDANQMTSKTEYDFIGRVSRKKFLGDGQPGSGDRPVDYTYVDIDVGLGVKQLVSLKSVQDTNPGNEGQRIETQDYYDGLGRKVISRRLNPDGQFAWRVMHYDEIGHADLVSNWSFFTPPGLNADGTVSNAAEWTNIPLSNYIKFTVGAYTESCFRLACGTTVGTYEFAGRPLRVKRIAQGGAQIISQVDTQYFGFNTRVTTYGLNSIDATAPGAITTHYSDGYGNLRVVDADEGGSGGGKGADAIYDYDYANRLIKVNLVAQVTLSPFAQGGDPGNGGDRYATANGEHQPRFFTFDSLGRQTQAQNQENGITKYLKFNALGQVLEAEDENGRAGGGPGGGVFSDTAASTQFGGCLNGTCRPNLVVNGCNVIAGQLTALWNGAGKQGGAPVAAAGLYYKVELKGAAMTGFALLSDWTLGLRSWNATGFSDTAYSLRITTAYEPDPQEANESRQAPDFTCIVKAAVNPYHLKHAYDSRGREVAVIKAPLAGGESVLRQFDYESGADCAATRTCGKLVSAAAMRAGTGNVTQSFTFRVKDGRMVNQRLIAPHVNNPDNLLAFDYDGFGRQNLAMYPDGRQIKLEFQSGGVKSVNKLEGITETHYATMGRLGDYHADGSLAVFLQGNGLTFHRYIDEAERVSQLCYNDFPSSPEFIAPCTLSTEGREVWNSGFYRYDGVGNIMAIGSFASNTDTFTHDRLNRLKSATINRHPHLNGTFLEPAGFVAMSYDYDMFGNITKRYQTNTMGSPPYLAGSDPLERFGATTPRDYTNGSNTAGVVVPDNKIHDAGFLYDGNGNMVSDGHKDFVYDELNQQYEVRDATTACVAAVAGGNTPHANKGQIQHANPNSGLTPANIACYGQGRLIESNIYAADGMRAIRHVEKIMMDGSTRVTDTVYVRLGGNVVKEYTEQKDTPGASIPTISHEKAYIYGPLGLLATEEICNFKCDATDTEDLATTRYYEYDHLGTVRAITTGTGALESTFDYEPFGLELKGTTVSFTDSSSNTHRFTGHERDEEAGEDYMKARMYVLSTARFPQIDPMFGGAGNPQNWNAYTYVGNSPVGASDPTGMATVLEKAEVMSSPFIGRPANNIGAASAAGGGAGSTFSQDFRSAALAAGWTQKQITDALHASGIGSSAANTTQQTTGTGVVAANQSVSVLTDSSSVVYDALGCKDFYLTKNADGGDGQTYSIRWDATFGNVYALDGTPIEATKAIGPAEIIVTKANGESDIPIPINNYSSATKDYNNITNCHGSSFAGGQVWIENNQVAILLPHSGFTTTNGSGTGSIGIYSESGRGIVHSVTRTGNDRVYSKAGVTPGKETRPGPGSDTAWSNPDASLIWYSRH